MSVAIEKIVRPFGPSDIFQPRQNSLSQPALLPSDHEPPRFQIKGSHDGSVVDAPTGGGFKINAEWVEDKSRRVTEKVRVENPNDSDQYVVTERIKQMVIKYTKSSEEIPIKMDWSGAT